MRRAIANQHGIRTPASRSLCETWIEGIVSATLDDVTYEWDQGEKAKEQSDG